MWSVLSQLLAPAMVVAAAPLSIIVAIFLVLHTQRARANGVVFLAGRLPAFAAVTAAFMQATRLTSDLNRPSRRGSSSPWAASFSRSEHGSGCGAALRPRQFGGRRAGVRVPGSRRAGCCTTHPTQGVAAPTQRTRVSAVNLVTVGIILLFMGVSELHTEGA